MVKTIKRICGQCKQSFERSQMKETSSGINFCSRPCYLALKREERQCVECKELFTVKKSSPAILCSKACCGVYNGRRQRKFTVKQIEVVKKKYAQGYTRKQLAEVYGVNPWTITRIVKGETEGR